MFFTSTSQVQFYFFISNCSTSSQSQAVQKGWGTGGYGHFRTLQPCHSLFFTLSPFFIMGLFHGLQSSRSKLPQHATPALLPEILLLHEHIHLLQLKLSAACSVALHVPQESRLLHYDLPCGLCGFSSFPHLGSAGSLRFVTSLSHGSCHTALFTMP